MEISAAHAPYLWLVVGMLFLAVEAFGLPGIGMLFAGLGALVTGIVIAMGLAGAENIPAQFAWFFGATTISGILLWKPMKRFRMTRPGAKEYSNIVGQKAVIGKGGLKRGHPGNVIWSGASMVGEIAVGCAADELPEGETVTVTAIEGSRLQVSS